LPSLSSFQICDVSLDRRGRGVTFGVGRRKIETIGRDMGFDGSRRRIGSGIVEIRTDFDDRVKFRVNKRGDLGNGFERYGKRKLYRGGKTKS